MLDNPCPGGPSTFLHCEPNTSVHLDCKIHLLPGTPRPLLGLSLIKDSDTNTGNGLSGQEYIPPSLGTAKPLYFTFIVATE